MGFCHRVSNRLHKQAELLRRLNSISVLNFLHKNGLHRTKAGKDTKSLRSFYIGLSFIFTFFAFSSRQSSPKYTFLSLVTGGLLMSFLGFVRLMDVLSNMDDFHLNCNFIKLVDWKSLTSKVLCGTQRYFLRLERTFLEMKNFSILINQLVFFCLCERVFMIHQPVVSFYTLMFFNVVAYCVSYIKELIEREDWSMYVHVARGSNVRHLAMSTTKIALEWTKAITFIITIIFILLVFGLEKGLKNYSPGIPYLVLTAVYFILSEKVFVQLICKILDLVKFECFENMESLYSPLILKGIQIVLSFIFTIICGLLGHSRITILSCFTNIRVKYREVDSNHWQPLVLELVRLMRFRCANREELLRHDDVCAICLLPMKTARVTPCRHLFHADCLRKCLKQTYSQSCPICKQSLPALQYQRRF